MEERNAIFPRDGATEIHPQTFDRHRNLRRQAFLFLAMEKPKSVSIHFEVQPSIVRSLRCRNGISLDLAVRFANDVHGNSSDDPNGMGRLFKDWRSRTEEGDESELETPPRRRNCTHGCHRAWLDHGDDVRSGRFGMVVGRSGRGWRHRRIDRFDNRKEIRPLGRSQLLEGAGNPLRWSLHHP